MKRISALLIAAFMCMGLLSACQSSELQAYTGKDDTETAKETANKDYTPCFESYDPDEVMMTINGIDVTWRELFYFYHYDVSTLENYYGDITDWDDTAMFDGKKSYRDYVVENGLETVKHYCALESKAEDMGVELSDEARAKIEERWKTNVESYGKGDEEAFIKYLESTFLSKELYDHINEISALYESMRDEMYGTNGDKLEEGEVLQKAKDMGYKRAKHIFLSTYDSEHNKLSEEELAGKKAQLQTMLDELSAIVDPVQLESRLDELAAQNSEDPGLKTFPDGYTFQEGKMDQAFAEAVSDTEENKMYPGVVESSMGYHVILRLPLSTTAAVEFSSEDDYRSLPYYVAESMFGALTDSWADECEVVYSKAYKKMDIAKIFAKAKAIESPDK